MTRAIQLEADAAPGTRPRAAPPLPSHELWAGGRGPIRNFAMAKLGARVLIAFPGSRGTESMLDAAKSEGIPVVKIKI